MVDFFVRGMLYEDDSSDDDRSVSCVFRAGSDLLRAEDGDGWSGL